MKNNLMYGVFLIATMALPTGCASDQPATSTTTTTSEETAVQPAQPVSTTTTTQQTTMQPQ